MQKFILQEHTQEQREQILAASKKSERITYTRNLTEAEIDFESKRLADNVKKLAQEEEAKKDIMRECKDRIDGIRATMSSISQTLLDGTKEVTEKCFKVINMEGREVGFYNVHGELVKVRALLDDDLQMDMFEDQQEAEPVAAIEAPENEAEQAYEEAAVVEG